MSSAAGEPTTTKELGVEIRFRLTLPGEPSGTIDLGRLEGFAKAFRAATLKSAQASLSIPSFRHSLGDEPRPDYRLVDLTDGSTTLVLASSDDRPVTREAVSRHLEAVEEYDRTGAWPPYVYPGELQAWAEVYQTLFRRSSGAEAVVSVDGRDRRVTHSSVEALAREPIRPLYREVVLIGTLHLIDSEGKRRFQIGNKDADLSFDLGDDPVEVIDPFRWKRVRAHALWEVGSRRGILREPLEQTEEPMGIEVLRELDAPDWVVGLLERTESFKELPAGWNDPGSLKVSAARVEAAKELIRRLHERYADAIPEGAIPSFVPNSSGGLEFDWEVRDRFLNVELVEGGYDILATERDRDLYSGPANQREVFAWIQWLLTGESPPRAAGPVSG